MPGPYTYQNDIPAATDQLSVSQGDIETNFASIESLIDIDHVDFADNNAGQHNQITLPLNSNSPAAPMFAATTLGIYNLVPAAAPLTGINEMFINKLNNGGVQQQVPITASILSTNAAPSTSTGMWSCLPSGFILQAGTFSVPSGTTVTFPIAFPNACLIVTVSNTNLINNYLSSGTNAALTKTTFSPVSTNANAIGNYFAIGY